MMNPKGVQKLMEFLASLSHFISWLGECGMPLYKLLKKASQFTWTAKAQEAFEKLKMFLAMAPTLVSLKKGEPLLIYIATTTQVVSAALVIEREESGHSHKIQRLVYFISEVLSDTKVRYLQIQKLIYAILITKQKSLHYFEGHPIVVMVSTPLGNVVQNHDASGHMAKWATELMGCHITYVPRTVISRTSSPNGPKCKRPNL
jgi:hypothetical protein